MFDMKKTGITPGRKHRLIDLVYFNDNDKSLKSFKNHLVELDKLQ